LITKTQLLSFGDSWPSGVGLLPGEKSFAELLSEFLNTDYFKNFASPGASNDKSVWELMQHLKHTSPRSDDIIALFFITTPGRNMLISHQEQIINFNMMPDDLTDSSTDLNKIYYTYFNTVPQENFNMHRNILSLQKICQQKMIKDFYIVGWNNLDLNCSGIDQTKIYPQTCIQILGFQNYNDYYFEDIKDQYLLPCRHPNQKGHQLIAEHLYHWIKDQLV
jgi:hypothetical protein